MVVGEASSAVMVIMTGILVLVRLLVAVAIVVSVPPVLLLEYRRLFLSKRQPVQVVLLEGVVDERAEWVAVPRRPVAPLLSIGVPVVATAVFISPATAPAR